MATMVDKTGRLRKPGYRSLARGKDRTPFAVAGRASTQETFMAHAGPHYGMQHGAAPAATHHAAAIQGAAKPAIIVLGLRAAMPIVGFVLFRILAIVSPVPRDADPREALELRQTIDAGLTGIEGLIALVGLILYFLWYAKVAQWIRETRGPTRFSTGLAIGGWFIPFANFFIPPMALRDVVRKGANDEGGGLVGLWWLSWILVMVTEVGSAVLRANPMVIQDIGTLNLVSRGLYWGGFVAQLAAYGLLAMIIKGVTKHAR